MFHFNKGLTILKIYLSSENGWSRLTVAVNTLELCELSAGATGPLAVRTALIQADHLPVVTTGLVTRHRLHQVRAVSRPSRRLVGDLSFSQFEPCSTTKSSSSTYVFDRQWWKYILYMYIIVYGPLNRVKYCPFTPLHLFDCLRY